MVGMNITLVLLALGLVGVSALFLRWARRYNSPAEWRAMCCYVLLLATLPLIGILVTMGVGPTSVVRALRDSTEHPTMMILVAVAFSPFLLRFVKRWGWKLLHLISTVCLGAACLSVAGHVLWNAWYAQYDLLWQEAIGGVLVALVMWWARRGIYRESPIQRH
jgi:hypothetical protein